MCFQKDSNLVFRGPALLVQGSLRRQVRVRALSQMNYCLRFSAHNRNLDNARFLMQPNVLLYIRKCDLKLTDDRLNTKRHIDEVKGRFDHLGMLQRSETVLKSSVRRSLRSKTRKKTEIDLFEPFKYFSPAGA